METMYKILDKVYIILNMDAERVKEIESEIADLKARWPPHSVPPRMWQQLEELEKKLEEEKGITEDE